MEGQAKELTMRAYITGTKNTEGSKVADRVFKYRLDAVQELAQSNDQLRTLTIAGQQKLRQAAHAIDVDTGAYTFTEVELIDFASRVSPTVNAPLQRGKTDMEKAADLFAKLSPEESAEVVKADKERRKAEVAA